MSRRMRVLTLTAAAPLGPPYPGTAINVRGTSGSNVWVTVQGTLTPPHDALQWTGAAWTPRPYNSVDPANYTPTGLYVAGPDAVWVQNFYQTNFWDGTAWAFDFTRYAGAGEVFKGLYGFGSDVWALHTEPTNPTLVIWTDHRSGLGSWAGGSMSNGTLYESMEPSSGAAWDTEHIWVPITETEDGIHVQRQIVLGSLTGGGYAVEFDQAEVAVAVIGATSATQAYGSTQGTFGGLDLLSRDGGSWNRTTLGPIGPSIDVWPQEAGGVAGDEWLVGYYRDSGGVHWPFAGHNTGGGWVWTDLASLLTALDAVNATLYSVVRLPDGTVWAAGVYSVTDAPTSALVLVMRYSGGVWAVVPVPATI